MQDDECFKCLGEFAFIFEINLGFESGDQAGRRDLLLKKLETKKSPGSVPLR
jgi:hypothetical protein